MQISKFHVLIDTLVVISFVVTLYLLMDLREKLRASESQNEDLALSLKNQPHIGDEFWPLPGVLISGASDMVRPGKRRFVIYGNPGCGSCKDSIAAWSNVVSAIGAENVLVIVPSAGKEKALAFSKQIGQGLAVSLVMNEREISRRGLRSVPKTMLLDKSGSITMLWDGRFKQREAAEARLIWRQWYEEDEGGENYERQVSF